MPYSQIIRDLAATAHSIQLSAFAMGVMLHRMARQAPPEIASELEVLANCADNISSQAGAAEAEAETVTDDPAS